MRLALGVNGRTPVSAIVLPTLTGGGLLIGTGVVSLPCWFRLATGMACPFCGGSRMVGALLHGDLSSAFHFNAFALVVVLPTVLAVLAAMVARDLGSRARPWPSGRRGIMLAGALVAVGLLWWVLRNTAFAGFDTALTS